MSTWQHFLVREVLRRSSLLGNLQPLNLKVDLRRTPSWDILVLLLFFPILYTTPTVASNSLVSWGGNFWPSGALLRCSLNRPLLRIIILQVHKVSCYIAHVTHWSTSFQLKHLESKGGRWTYFGYVLDRTPKSEWYVDWWGPKNGCQKNMCLKRDWIACSNYDNHYRFNSEHNSRDLFVYHK